MTTSHIKVRVDSVLKSSAQEELKAIDSDLTELVESALVYVVKHRELPNRGGWFDGVRDWLCPRNGYKGESK